MSFLDVLFSLAESAGLLGLILTAYTNALRRVDKRPRLRTLTCGLLFGGGAVLSMMAPIQIIPGVFIDARSIMLGLAAPFGGIPAAVLAGTIAGAYRCFWNGGVGAVAGTAGIMLCSLAGIAFVLMFRRSLGRLRTGHFLILGTMASSQVLSAFLLPSWADAIHTVSTAGLPLAIMTVVGILLFGTMLSRERERIDSIHALRTSEARHRAIFDTAVDAITIIDHEGRLVAFNPAAERMFGYAAADVIGQNVCILIPEPDRSAHDAHLARHRKTGERRIIGIGREVQGRRRDGGVFPLDLSIAEWESGDGQRHFTGIMRDISERKRTAAELQRAKDAAEAASQAKSEFLAGLSHELRSPLNAIIGFADMTRNEVSGPLGDPSYREWANDICDSGQHLLELINEILDHAKAEAGKLTLQEEDVDLLKAVDFCTRMLEPRAKRAGLTLSSKVAAEVRFIRADEKRLRQILLNLISNAVKYTPSGGQVDVVADLDAFGGLVLSVVDTGIGVAEDNLIRMFESFWRADDAGARDVEGTGLGLPLTRRLVELHGGVIQLSSVVGRGTTATVRFPRDRILRRPSRQPTRSGAVEPLDILLVEDDALIRVATMSTLEDQGHRVKGAANANEALVILRGDQPLDLLFSDIVMPPGMNGAELARLAQRLRPGLAILLTSGFAGHAVASEDGTDRGYAMIAKPYSGAELNRKILAAMQEGAGDGCPERSSRSATGGFGPERPMPAAYGAIR
ncbi:PAS domain S-box protein [Skermanella pratensis]|uniref:PAS domain S-box protein n=1 Tax=Skermanella pratensis TaxID=2233999 RepID=UPI001301931F|nr:PAS domain S-box protein [Skermanella pratensis]